MVVCATAGCSKQSLERAVSLDPQLARAQCELGVFELREGHLVEAEKGFNAALAREPEILQAQLALALALLTQVLRRRTMADNR